MRLLGLLFLLALIVAGVGWCRGWFVVRTTHAGERDRVELTVDRDRIEEDAAAAKRRIEGAADDREAAGALREFEGRIVSIDTGARRLRLAGADETREFTLALDVVVVDQGRTITLAQLATGDRVRVETEGTADRRSVVRVERL